MKRKNVVLVAKLEEERVKLIAEANQIDRSLLTVNAGIVSLKLTTKNISMIKSILITERAEEAHRLNEKIEGMLHETD